MGVIFAILGGILKWILLILLGLLGLILLVLLILLFTPLRYKLRGQKSSDSLWGKVQVSWLLHLISFHLAYQEKEIRWEVKLGPKVLLASYPIPKKEKKPKKPKPQKPPQAETEAGLKESPAESETLAATPTLAETSPPKEAAPPSEKTAAEEKRPAPAEVPPSEETREPFPAAPEKKTWREKVTEVCWKIRRFFEKLMHPFQSLYEKVKKLRSRWDELKEKWEKYPQKGETVRAVKELAAGLVRPVLPRSCNIELLFGFDDPATTGKVLGYYYMLWPLLFPKETRRRKLKVDADFKRSVMEFNGWCRGHFCVASFLGPAVRALLNPHIRRLIRYIRANTR